MGCAPRDVRSPPVYAACVARCGVLLSLLLVALTLAIPAGSAAAPLGAMEDYDPPLTISIDTLNPSYIPSSGIVRVTGEVSNVDEVDWVDINVNAVLGDVPMTTSAELTEAVATGPLEFIGDRIITATPGTQDTIDLIEPGDSAPFSLAIPRSELSVTEAGVYWFGVHAIGSSETDPRDSTNIADGRARTFIPFVPETTPGEIKTALVIPLRRYLDFAPNGSLADPDSWGTTLMPGGRLRDTVDFGAAAGDRPISWLVDPALPDAVRRLSNGNGGRSISPTLDPVPDEGEVPPAEPEEVVPETGDSEESDDASEDPDAAPDPAPALPPQIAATAEAAAAWLDRLDQALTGSEVFTLPYGDLDVAAAADLDPGVYARARNRTGTVLTALGIESNPAIGAPSGYLNEAGFGLVDDQTVLITDQMFGADPPGVAQVDGDRVAITSSGVAAGGPGPGRPLSVVNLRQRLLAEAAVRLFSPGRPPLVVQLPPKWRPTAGADFFTGLDVDWLELTTVEDATDRAGFTIDPEDLDYPDAQARRELNRDNFEAADSLTRAGETLENLLALNDRVGSAVGGQALTSLSYGARKAPAKARTSALTARAWVAARLRAVEITAPSGVTLTGSSGEFGAIVENKLDQPVTVGITAEADDGQITIEPIEPISLAPGARTSVNLTAVSTDAGVHNVRLMLTDGAGFPLGSSDALPIRSAQVSGLIWVIMGVGAILLFGTIALRLIRRIRGERAERSPA